jgi:hypothetical protein
MFTTHVYVDPEDVDRFVASILATFGGTITEQTNATTLTPTPSTTKWTLVVTPFGTLSVFGYKTPLPYPFGTERAGYLVTDIDVAVQAARSTGADVIVTPWPDPIGGDAVIQWPGGVNMQFYWHTAKPSYKQPQNVPEDRVYVSVDRVEAFTHSFLTFSHGEVISDEKHAPGIEIGQPTETYRRIRIQSTFGKLTVLVTDGHLPYPYGRETTGYEVASLADTLGKAKAAGAETLVAPYTTDGRDAAVLQFPGGYIAEVHSAST